MKYLESLSEYTGKLIRWLTLLTVIVMTLVVVLRYGFNLGWIALQESTIYLHAVSLMLGMAFVLKHDGHVRVDIFYRGFSVERQRWINFIGHLVFLIPTCVFLIYISWNYVSQSWSIFEGSQESGGIPLVYVIKSLIIAMPVLLILQALSECLSTLHQHVQGNSAKITKQQPTKEES